MPIRAVPELIPHVIIGDRVRADGGDERRTRGSGGDVLMLAAAAKMKVVDAHGLDGPLGARTEIHHILNPAGDRAHRAIGVRAAIIETAPHDAAAVEHVAQRTVAWVR